MYEWEHKTGMAFYSWTANHCLGIGDLGCNLNTVYHEDNYCKYLQDGPNIMPKFYDEGAFGILRGYSAQQLPVWVVIHGKKLPSDVIETYQLPSMLGEIMCDLHMMDCQLRINDKIDPVDAAAELNRALEEKYPDYEVSFALSYAQNGKFGCTGVMKRHVHFSLNNAEENEKTVSEQKKHITRLFNSWVQPESWIRFSYSLEQFEMKGGMKIPTPEIRLILGQPDDIRKSLFLDLKRLRRSTPSSSGIFSAPPEPSLPEKPKTCCSLL